MRHASTTILSLKKLPAAVRNALLRTAGRMADRGAFFNATDVVRRPAPFNRFIRGGRSGAIWYVWYEHGGFAYWRQVALFDGSGKTLADARADNFNLCVVTDRMIRGLRSGR